MKRSQVGNKTFPSWVIGLPLRLSKKKFALLQAMGQGIC
jgi:hypothetical protein